MHDTAVKKNKACLLWHHLGIFSVRVKETVWVGMDRCGYYCRYLRLFDLFGLV